MPIDLFPGYFCILTSFIQYAFRLFGISGKDVSLVGLQYKKRYHPYIFRVVSFDVNGWGNSFHFHSVQSLISLYFSSDFVQGLCTYFFRCPILFRQLFIIIISYRQSVHRFSRHW